MFGQNQWSASGILVAALGVGCVDPSDPPEEQEATALTAVVEIDSDEVLARVPAYAFGIHTSVYDNALHDPELDNELETAGITMLRYPGGGYSDNYHWATHRLTAFADGNPGYLAPGSDFGSYLEVVFNTESAVMITVNYGSNQAGTGPGEPKEAAAWVAYANGDPSDETVIGEDSTGEDWRTVGYWASLRAADELAEDDGLNFLRISRDEPVGIEYWEIGNEVFGNGFYASGTDVVFELDLHVPYDGTRRLGHPDLSGTSYGQGVAEYAREMKAVDPDIKIGAVLVTPPDDDSWAPTWNDDVLSRCADDIEFGVVHWYPNREDLLNAPQFTIPIMFDRLKQTFRDHVGARADEIEITVTEVGTAPGAPERQIEIGGLFAGDAYLHFIEQGAANVAWLELHNGTFLSERGSRRGRAYQGIRLAHMVADVGDSLVATSSSVSQSALVVHAGVREDGHRTVMLTNTHKFLDAMVTVSGFEASGEAEIYRYDPFGDDNGTSDQVEGPEHVEFEAGEVSIELPWRSMAVVVPQ
jgi:hypothetical protein